MQPHLFRALAVALAALPAAAAERVFDFSALPENQAPPGFRSAVTGQGRPGDWRIIRDPAPGRPLPGARAPAAERAVLAQLAQDHTDEHFPLLIFDEEVYGDFTLTTRFKTVSGVAERMAGVVFRLQNETNYYVVRASTLGNTFRFYKVVDGARGTIVGPEIPISSGEWHELSVECKGNQIRCLLEGKEVIPPLSDSTFGAGKIGFWTKSDSVSYFADTRIVYTPREVPARRLVREALKTYPRLLALKVYIAGASPGTSRVIASKDEKDIGQSGGKTEQGVLADGDTYYGKEKQTVSVIMPLRDRNGDPIAAVRVVMKSFAGQTEQNAIIRAMPIVKEMQATVTSMQDLTE